MNSIDRIYSARPEAKKYKYQWMELSNYPTALAIYSTGITSIEVGNWSLLSKILLDLEQQRSLFVLDTESPGPPMTDIHPSSISGSLPYDNNTIFIKGKISEAVEAPVKRTFSNPSNYERCFAIFDMLFDIEFMHQIEKATNREIRPPHRLGHRQQWPDGSLPLEEEYDTHGGDWMPLQVGFFGGSSDRFEELLDRYPSRRLR